MKIVYLSAPFFSDCDFPLVRELQRQGHDIYFFIDLSVNFTHSTLIDIKSQIRENSILPASVYKEFDFFKNYFELEKVFVVNRTHRSEFHPFNIKVQFELMKRIREINPDVIQTTRIPDMFWTMLYQFRNKMFLTVHDPFPHTGEMSMRVMFFRKIAFRVFSKFILLNKSQFVEFRKVWNLNESQISLNRLGPYDCIKLFLPKNNVDKTISSRNILFYGRISPYKGIEYLLNAMEIVHEKIPDLNLTIAGGGKMYFDVSKYDKLSYVNIQNNFISIEQLALLIEQASVVVCPYTDATQSGVVLTSFAMNKPVIATDVGALGEYIENGVTGLLVPPRDSIALADAIVDLFSDSELLSKMHNSVKERNLSDADGWEGIAKRYIEFYNS